LRREQSSYGPTKANDDRAYLGRKPSYTREQFAKVRDMLGQAAMGIAAIANEVGLSRQTVYRIKGDPTECEAALAAWGL
jgi:putative DNA-invertase from lambdoid prophage Rac